MEKIEIYKSVFNEMSFERNQIEQRIISSNIMRLEHLILIYFLPKDSANKHWQGEVYSSLVTISRMKWSKNNKYLSYKDYFNYLWNKPFENKDDYEVIDLTVDDLMFDGYKISKKWIDKKDEFVYSLKEFYKKVSLMFSKGNFKKEELYKLIEKF